MNLEKKYLDISVKKTNEHFGLFNIRNNNSGIEKFTDTNTHWMFNDDGLRKYDDNGDALFDNTGKQIFDIDENGIKKPLGKEKFTDLGSVFGGINDNKFLKQSYENNQNINKSVVDNSVSNIFNNVTNNVMQNNITAASAAAGALNEIVLKNINCKNVTISGIDQDATAQALVISKATQTAKNSITTNIATNIQKTLENIKKATQFSDYSDENKNAASVVTGLFGLSDPRDGVGAAMSLGNMGLFDSNNKLDSTISKNIHIDDSTTIKSENNIQNLIKNNVNQKNLATCAANAASDNSIDIEDIQCKGTLTVGNVQQTAYAQAIAKCTFDQKSESTINNTITTQISSSFNQVYDDVLTTIEAKYGAKDANGNYGPKDAASAKAAYAEYYESTNKINALGRLHAAVLNTAACTKTNQYGVSSVDKDCLKALQETSPSSQEDPNNNGGGGGNNNNNNNKNNNNNNDDDDKKKVKAETNYKLIIYILIGFIVFILICVGIYFALG